MNNSSKVKNSPIFIVGPPRSGTTLVAKILGKHSRIFMPGETHFFDDIYSMNKQLSDLSNQIIRKKIIHKLSMLYNKYNEPSDQKRIDKLFSDGEIINKLESSCKSFRDIFSSFMEIQMLYEGKSRWGNNTPRDIFNLDEILSFYPNAKILVCLRDVRDFLLSYKYKWRVTAPENIKRIKRMYHPVLTSLLWKSSVRIIPKIKSKISKDNLLIIKYEKLVEDPVDIVLKMCDFLGEKFEEKMLDIDSQNSSFQQKNRGIFISSVGRWRKLLSKEEIFIAQLINRRELNYLDYSLEKIHINPLKVILIFISFPYGLLRALNAGKDMHGPFLNYIGKRAISLFRKDYKKISSWII